MLCNYLKEIYLEYIHIGLDTSELIYSKFIQDDILKLWNLCEIKTHPELPQCTFYILDGHIWFDLDKEKNILYYNENIIPSCWAYYGYYDMDKLIKTIINEMINDETIIIANYVNLPKHMYVELGLSQDLPHLYKSI